MREFKFRVWNEDMKKMHTQEDLEKLIRDICKTDFVTGMFIPKSKGNVVMQYTGLKDKDRTEIYEGDIVEFYFDGKKKVSEIFYTDNKGFCFRFESYGYDYVINVKELKIHYRETKVIGNIYENKDLIV